MNFDFFFNFILGYRFFIISNSFFFRVVEMGIKKEESVVFVVIFERKLLVLNINFSIY